MKLLIHTPVCNRAWVLPQFFISLCEQDFPRKDVVVFFDVNDSQDETYNLCKRFAIDNQTLGFQDVQVRSWDWPHLSLKDHKWSAERYHRMIQMRNDALRMAYEKGCSHLLSIDSDVIMREPDTIRHLVQAGVPIIAGVFLARWGNPKALALPNVWQYGQNEMTDGFLANVKAQSNHFVVGGLGACTLISAEVFERRTVTYDPIYNLPSDYRGEDRYFCTRAAAAGFILQACSHKRIDHLDRVKESEVV